jgi:radical SAM enzyme (TIGR01210 family)
LHERERLGDGSSEETFTIFLAGAECPFTCVFCDLWQYTLDTPTPVGAIPRQIRSALEEIPADVDSGTLRIKLYNASNFFDDRAVPPVDDEEIAELLSPFAAVTVEAHPKLVGGRCLDFARRLSPRLEVAMGLETVDPQVLAALNKKSTVADFDRAAATLRASEIDVRAFVLLAPPHQPPESAVQTTVISVGHALDSGARFVAINPVRPGNGYLDALSTAGEWTPPTLPQLEEALGRSLGLGAGVVAIDLWEVDGFRRCPDCDDERIGRLRAMNADGIPRRALACESCGAAAW